MQDTNGLCPSTAPFVTMRVGGSHGRAGGHLEARRVGSARGAVVSTFRHSLV
jgi:hypothetical protein